jgi:hypothetical protein
MSHIIIIYRARYCISYNYRMKNKLFNFFIFIFFLLYVHNVVSTIVIYGIINHTKPFGIQGQDV